jgi:hypothetical protein
MNRDLLDALSDICHARASFFRRSAGNWNIYPQMNVTQFLANETSLLSMLSRFQTPPPPPVPAPAPPAAAPLDMSLNLVQMLFGRDAFVGLGQRQGQGQGGFWDPVQIGLTTEQFAAGTREYENPPDVAEQDQCCICQEGITTEAAIHTLCPGPPLDDGVTVTNHHSLHRRCAQAWFSMSPRCPLCRADLRTLNPTTTNAGPSAGAPGGDTDSDTAPDSQ